MQMPSRFMFRPMAANEFADRMRVAPAGQIKLPVQTTGVPNLGAAYQSSVSILHLDPASVLARTGLTCAQWRQMPRNAAAVPAGTTTRWQVVVSALSRETAAWSLYPTSAILAVIDRVDAYCGQQARFAAASKVASYVPGGYVAEPKPPYGYALVGLKPAGQVAAWAPAGDSIAAVATNASNVSVRLNSLGQPIPGTVTDASNTTVPDTSWTGAPTSIYDALTGNTIPVSFYGTGNLGGATAGAPVGGGLSPQSQAALFGAVGGALNTTGTAIGQIIASGNAQQIAQLTNQTNLQIAQLNAATQRAQQQGNLQLAAQLQAQQAPLLQFQQMLALRQSPATMALWVVGGLAALGIVGAIVYFSTRPSSTSVSATTRTTRANPFGVLTNPVKAVAELNPRHRAHYGRRAHYRAAA